MAVELDLRDVTVRFGDTTALDSLSTRFRAGTSTALVGPNGSGKTTLLKALAKMLRPASGTITGGEGATIAFVLQHRDATHWVPLTVGEVIRMGRYRSAGLLGRLNTEDKQIIDEAATRMEVDDLMKRQFGELSGGQQQRTVIAQALAQQPSVLLLDEPITGLDLASQERILALIDEETDRGTLVVLSTHHLDEARHCDQVLLLSTKLIAAGPPDDVLTPEHLRDAYGGRFLGAHRDHDHDTEMLILDDHGHGHSTGHRHEH